MAKSKGIKSKRKTKTVPYDVAEQLRTPEEMAAYLDAWFEEAPRGLSGCGCTRWPREDLDLSCMSREAGKRT